MRHHVVIKLRIFYPLLTFLAQPLVLLLLLRLTLLLVHLKKVEGKRLVQLTSRSIASHQSELAGLLMFLQLV